MQMAQRSSSIRYSIVIGARNEAPRIANSLDSLHAYLTVQNIEAQTEVIVVTTRGADKTPEIVKPYKDKFTHFVQIAPETPVGKGRDIRLGMLAARGEYVCFMDADMATPLHNLKRLFKALETKPLVVGERDLKTMHHDLLRKVSSNVSHWFIRAMVGLRLKDTQCGFKGFQKKYIEQLFEPLITTGWGFDIEVLLRAKSAGVPITELAITDWSDPKPAGSGLIGQTQSRAMIATLKEVAAISLHRFMGDYLITEKQKVRRGVGVAVGIACVWFFVIHLTFLVGYGHLKNNNPAITASKPAIGQTSRNYDANYYYYIAQYGYRAKGSIIRLLAFFPLYPSILRIGRMITFNALSYEQVAFWLNLLFVCITAALLYRLSHKVRIKQPLLPVVIWLVYPWSLFLGAMYTEALYCMLVVACLYLLLEKRFVMAAIGAAFASATRLPGVLLSLVASFSILGSVVSLPSKPKVNNQINLTNFRRLTLFPVTAAGLIIWLAYQWHYFGSPFAFRDAYKEGWAYQVFNINIAQTILLTVVKAFEGLRKHVFGNELFQVAAWFGALSVALMSWMRKLHIPWYWYIFIATNLVLITLNSTMVSVQRYVMPIMVLYPMLALIYEKIQYKHKSLLLVIALSACFIVQIIMAILYTNAFPVG